MAEWITTKEAGELLGVSIRTIQRYVEGGKLKAKVVSGKNSVKKDAILKLKPNSQSEAIAATSNNNDREAMVNPEWQIPEGYLLIDKSTLDSLKEQINKLTDSVKEMQLTQKLLIEKGLNLRNESINALPATDKKESNEVTGTPIETVAKAHEEFFGEKPKKKSLSMLWLALGAIIGIVLLLLIVNFIASQSL